MKGQMAVTEILTIIGMIVVIVALIPVILPFITKTIESFVSNYPEIVSKDLASLISTSVASTGNIRIDYEFPSSDYSVRFSGRTIYVSREHNGEIQQSSAPILIDTRGTIPTNSRFTIEKRIKDGLVSYYVNNMCISGDCPDAPPEPPGPGPSPPYIPPIGKSKLGIQTQFRESHIMDFIREAKPIIVKLMESYDMAQEIKQISPNTFIIGRKFDGDQLNPIGNPEQKAEEWFDKYQGLISGNPGFDCWEGYNEPILTDAAGMQWYSRFEIKRMKKLENIGQKACIGNFAVGNPEIELWEYFMGALSYASNNGHYLALHEYGNPSMQSDSEWLSLRHRKVYDQYGLTLPLVITETGIDTCGTEDCGWKSKTSSDDFLNQLKWYDSELQKDNYVIGAAIYHYAIMGWDSFEIYPELTGSDGVSGPLTTYIRDSGGYT